MLDGDSFSVVDTQSIYGDVIALKVAAIRLKIRCSECDAW